MDIQPQTTKPISDDQELAKVLAGVTQTPINTFGVGGAPNTNSQTVAPSPAIPNLVMEDKPAPEAPAASSELAAAVMPAPITSTPSDDLDGIKKQALIELRPLVDKLDLEPEEKFDIYLLLLRSTDDRTLIDPAHKTATEIADETKRAQALLDVIKEIDYLSNPPVNA
jgi:hypothetical protein